MTYHERLHSWCIIAHFPNLQRRVVARFRRRNDAEAHLRTLRQLGSNINCEIVFDPGLEQPDSSAEMR